jgi:hypothetical protein
MIHRLHISRGLQHAELRDRENFKPHGSFYAIFLRCLRSIGQSKTLGSVGSGPRGLDAWNSRLPSEHRKAHEQVHNITQCASEILPDDKIPMLIHLSFNRDKRGRFPAFSTLDFHFTTLHSTGTTKTKWKILSKRAHHQTMFQNSLKILQSLQQHLQEEPLYLSMARKHTLLHGRLSRFCWLWRQLSFLFHS